MPDPTPATYTINWSSLLESNLISFTAKHTDNAVVLNWTAAAEANVQYVIERSADGNRFDIIGSINGNNDVNEYAFRDNNPVSGTSSYYRIKLLDNSRGAVSYSNIEVVSFSDKFATTVFPVPFKDQVTIKTNLKKAGTVLIRLMDSKGMVLQQIRVEGNMGLNTFQFKNLATLTSSVYFVQVALPGEMILKKIFRQ